MTRTLHETRTLQLHDDLRLSLREAGDGDPFLLLHGGTGPDALAPVFDRYSGSRHVLAPVHPGWDGTPRPEWFTGIDDLATTYLDLLDDLDLRDVAVLGTSFGGWIAAEMAVRDGARRFGRLIVLGSVGPGSPGFQPKLPAPRAPQPGGSGPTAEGMALALSYANPQMTDPKLYRRLRRVLAPALVVWGENDTFLPPDFGRAFAAGFADGRFALIDGGQHVPLVDVPEATFAVMDTFLDGTP